jgi:hypothetical protein
VEFKLPEDLPEGNYTLTVCDSYKEIEFQKREMPHKFDPRTLGELFQSIQQIVKPQADHLYLRLPLGREDLAVRHRELPDLPESKAQILRQTTQMDIHRFSEALVRSVPTQYVLSGSASAGFEVQERPKETILRK